MHKGKSSLAGLSQLTSLRNSILKDGQLHGLGSIRPEVIGNQICVALSRPKMRIHTLSLGLAVSTRICNQQKVDQNSHTRRRTDQELDNLHFIAFPRFSISSRRKFSVFEASEAFERATSTFAVTTFSSCCARLSWSRKERIKESSLEEGARLSAAEEELPTVLYETGHASDSAEIPCKWGAWSRIAIQQIKTRPSINISKESSKSQRQFNSWQYSEIHHKYKSIVHHSLQARSVHWPGYVKLPAALLDGAPDALRFRAFAAALFSFLSAKKLVIRADKSRARSR
jgi:hypothetical protein